MYFLSRRSLPQCARVPERSLRTPASYTVSVMFSAIPEKRKKKIKKKEKKKRKKKEKPPPTHKHTKRKEPLGSYALGLPVLLASSVVSSGLEFQTTLADIATFCCVEPRACGSRFLFASLFARSIRSRRRACWNLMYSHKSPSRVGCRNKKGRRRERVFRVHFDPVNWGGPLYRFSVSPEIIVRKIETPTHSLYSHP